MTVFDTQRPHYHFLPPGEWLNDPNGPIWWQRQYHLFYQYGPRDHWDLKYWGHASSADLVRWKHLPIALAPTPGGPDAGGVWSGCAVDDHGTPALLYTGVQPETQCLAYGSPDLLTWEKYPGNPVIAAPPAELTVTGFRDPCVWREADGWYMLIGSGIKGVGGTALLYRSPDLRAWEFLHPLCVGDNAETGEMWECPDFFPLGDKHVLLFSPYGAPRYLVGVYADHRFIPESSGTLDFGGYCYAPKTFRDDAGRRILWGWSWEGRSDAAQHAAGWAGVMTLPRVLTLAPDGTLRYDVAREVLSLRGAHRGGGRFAVDGMHPLDVQSDSLEIGVTFLPGSAARAGLAVRRSPDGAEETRIVYDARTGEVSIEREHASLEADTHRATEHGPLKLAAGEALTLHVFVDRSIIEVFVNDRLCLTTRVYPTRADSRGVALLADGGEALVEQWDTWEMQGSW